jgi:hypothetical protein
MLTQNFSKKMSQISNTRVLTVDNTLRQSCNAGKGSGFIWVSGPDTDTDPDPNSESEFRRRKANKAYKKHFPGRLRAGPGA